MNSEAAPFSVVPGRRYLLISSCEVAKCVQLALLRDQEATPGLQTQVWSKPDRLYKAGTHSGSDQNRPSEEEDPAQRPGGAADAENFVVGGVLTCSRIFSSHHS